ncbi:MAG TPA: ATP-dependent metallopeptidase FtsH/Yme1/Tma family protein, partial [Thermomonas sp.]|nr:ATP-dependent metallopeptidase FtsH/Yme1/Tma family protein [Thermomonas sp.]
MNDLAKNLLLWVVVAAVLMVVFQSFSPDRATGAAAPSYSQFLDQVDDGNVQKVVFGNESRSGISQIEYTLKNGDKVKTNAPFDRDLVNVLREKRIDMVQQEPASGISLGAILMNFLPVLLIIGFWLFMMRQMQGGGGGKGAMSFGRSRAKLLNEDQTKVNFADVAGCDEAKEEEQLGARAAE